MDTLSILEVDLLESIDWGLDEILMLEEYLNEYNLSLRDYIEWRDQWTTQSTTNN